MRLKYVCKNRLSLNITTVLYLLVKSTDSCSRGMRNAVLYNATCAVIPTLLQALSSMTVHLSHPQFPLKDSAAAQAQCLAI